MRIKAMLLVLCASLVSRDLAHAGPSDARPEFEVASIKPSPPFKPDGPHSHIDGGPGTKDPERFEAIRITLDGLVDYAFDSKRHQYIPLPWMNDDLFDVFAKVPPGATKAEFKQMLQDLLIERFGLKTHWETKNMPRYTLEIAKSGFKLKESDATPGSAAVFTNVTTVPEGFLKLPSGNRPFVLVTNDGKVSMRRHDQTIGDIANQLSQAVGRPVIDQTSLKGTYNFELYYQMLGVHAADPADGSFAPAGGPTPFQAAEQQLGLHLQPGKGPVPIFVVDYANRKPTEN